MDLECTAGIAKIAIKAKEDAGIVTRVVRMTLVREFDVMIARALGGDALKLLESVEMRAASKVVMPIDVLVGECRLSGERGDDVTIKHVTGVKATGNASKKEDDEPTVELVFDFPFQLAAWDFFGQNVGARADLVFTKVQLALPGTEAPTKKSASEKKLQKAADRLAKTVGKGSTVSVTTSGKRTVIAESDGEKFVPSGAPIRDESVVEEQQASTPEEAEALREARLSAERKAEVDAIVEERTRHIEVRPAESDADWDAAFTASVTHRGIDFRFHGVSADEARANCVEAIRVFEVEQAVSYPSPAPGAADEIERLAAEQTADAERTKKSLLRAPTRGPRPTTHKTFGGGAEARARRAKPKGKGSGPGGKGKAKKGRSRS